jgi:hypothetical protein
MDIELLYVPDCPNRGTARRNLDTALANAGMTAIVREHEVASLDQAERFGMHGSPTIRVDGRDPFAAPDAHPSLSCRFYRGEHGTSGAPTVAQLAAVLVCRSVPLFDNDLVTEVDAGVAGVHAGSGRRGT